MAEGLGKRVLVVDDASLVRMYYRDALERAGYEVEEALNGLEALEKLHEAPADLLIVDALAAIAVVFRDVLRVEQGGRFLCRSRDCHRSLLCAFALRLLVLTYSLP